MVNPNIEAYKKWLEDHLRQPGDPWNLWTETSKKMGVWVLIVLAVLALSSRD